MPTITLTSDFGLQDHIAASVKGQLLQHLNDNPYFVDVSHTISNYNLPQAAYVVQGVLHNFPANTYHCVFVNLFEKKLEELLCFAFHNQYIFCADNGLVNLITNNTDTKIYAIPLLENVTKNWINFTQTIAKSINWLQSGNALEDIGIEKKNYIDKNNLRPIENQNGLEGCIIFVDKYENVITNITKTLFNKIGNNRKFKISFKRDEIIDKISETYADVQQGEKLALFNTNGYLEIAINQGNAAGLFGLLSYDSNNKVASNINQNDIYYTTVKVYFE
jgi:S-adenosyl-L-methionine hydrolase (adenosine-forming)